MVSVSNGKMNTSIAVFKMELFEKNEWITTIKD